MHKKLRKRKPRVAFRPLHQVGRVSRCEMSVNGVPICQQITVWPNRYDFSSNLSDGYLFTPNGITREQWALLGAEMAGIRPNEYGPGCWYYAEDYERAVIISIKLIELCELLDK